MDIGQISRVLKLSIFLLVTNNAIAKSIPDFYAEPGLNPHRSMSSSTNFDVVDPFSGKLQLHQTDIFIPGNAGFDLEVTRSYASIGIEGWSMHFGYVDESSDYSGCPTGVSPSNSGNPVLVLPDGSRQVLADVGVGFPSEPFTFPYITNKFWKASCGPSGGFIVTSPEGKTYEMTTPAPGIGVFRRNYVTKITDKNGNWVSFTYGIPQPYSVIVKTVRTSDGRALDYTYTAADPDGYVQLASITDGARTWKYSYLKGTTLDPNLSVGLYFLQKVTLPDNSTWEYTYNGSLGYNIDPALYGGDAIVPGSYLMKSVKTPQGAVINYSYDYVQFNSGGGYETGVTSRAVVDGATWNYAYVPSSGTGVLDKTTVTINDPVSGIHTETYSHFGYGTIAPTEETWKVGLLAQKKIGSVQTEDYTWRAGMVTNAQLTIRPYTWALKSDQGLYYPIPLSKNITRDEQVFKTNFTDVDFFANVYTTIEEGPNLMMRTKQYAYTVSTYNDPLWILHQNYYQFYNGRSHNQVLDVKNNVLYDSAHHVTTAYTYNTDGTVASMTPPGGATYSYDLYGFVAGNPTLKGTTYSNYKRGIPQTEVQQQGISLSRAVSDAGLVTSETNGNGYTTTYSYDELNRLTSVTPPLNNHVGIIYSPAISIPGSKNATRGALNENTQYDIFGKPVTVTLGGISTTYRYDGLGRVTFKSNPDSVLGTSYMYDDINRVTQVTNADGSTKTTTYGPLTRNVTDEKGRQTIYTYYAYGNPDETYLTGINTPDPAANITIVRDIRDEVSSVTQAGITRSYFISPNGYLYEETNPETGVTKYGRDDAGNMTSLNVGGTDVKWNTYDLHNRLILTHSVNGVNSKKVENTYSNTHKLISTKTTNTDTPIVDTSTVAFTYDANDNLLTETVSSAHTFYGNPEYGNTLLTRYSYNGNDQINSITYPVLNHVVTYTRDALGRATSVAGYVNEASYWPSGQVKQIKYQNGTVSNYEQNSARQWPTSFSTQNFALDPLISSAYTYDQVGNLKTVTDITTPALNRVFDYDSLDRLITINASGSWGLGSIVYDGAGNIKSQTYGTSDLAFNYSSQKQLELVTGSLRNASYTYDYLGNVSSNGTGKRYTYDYLSQLDEVKDDYSSLRIKYTYDGLGRRTVIAEEYNQYKRTWEVYDLGGKVLVSWTPANSATNVNFDLTEYIYLGGMRIAQRNTKQ